MAICQSKYCFRGEGFGIYGEAQAVAKKETFLATFVLQFNKNIPADSVSRRVDAGKSVQDDDLHCMFYKPFQTTLINFKDSLLTMSHCATQASHNAFSDSLKSILVNP